MAILLKCICLTTSDASPLIHGDIHRLKYTYTNLPYKATVVPSPTCPKSTVAFRYWDWKWCQDEQWLGLGNVLALAPRGGHHSLIWVYENVPKTWRGQKKRKQMVSQNTGDRNFPSSPFTSSLQHPFCVKYHTNTKLNNATFSYRYKITDIIR